LDTYATYPDAELVRLLQSGDRTAFETIYRRWLPSLYDVTYKRLKHKEQTEDVLQEVFARLWARREALQIADLAAYLYAAVRHETINYITRQKAVWGFYAPFESVLLEAESPDELFLAKEMLDLVLAFAETLPLKKREVFLLHVKDKLSTREIAEKLGISQKTVQNQLGRALSELRKKLMPVILAYLATRC
jgi:RNA polymerase sigma-70 factor (family 1)